MRGNERKWGEMRGNEGKWGEMKEKGKNYEEGLRVTVQDVSHYLDLFLTFLYFGTKTINNCSITFFEWEVRGRKVLICSTDTDKKPIMLYAHLDVVPVDDAPAWDYPPFEGRIAEGFIWGRGTLDAKVFILLLLF
jgi:acetylornithine deacetylase/succinyl-diaminopimelate desuccinylase-like protein